MVTKNEIVLKVIPDPQVGMPQTLPELSAAVYQGRLERVLGMMREKKLDYLFIYGDREHYANFEYLSGFDLRFEEGLVMLDSKGEIVYILGNECMPLAKQSLLPAKTELYQPFSLPNQPIDQLRALCEIIASHGVAAGNKVGIVGWKLMAPRYAERNVFDIPQFILAEIEKVVGCGNTVNVTDTFIEPENGIRILNTADEIAYFEYGAAWASIGVKDLLDNLRVGMSELEISRTMRIGAMTENSHPLTVVGKNNKASMPYPGNTRAALGEWFNCSLGLRGGLTCRTGYIAYGEEDLPEDQRDYLEALAKPYFAAVVNWYENVRIGVKACDVYNIIEKVLPKEEYHWKLNPGHYVATEEWVSSPFDVESKAVLKSGMCLQMDLIPGLEGYAGVNCEDGIALADDALREELKRRYPEVWERIEIRRRHMIENLHINLPDEVLPLSNLASTYRPYMLNRDYALAVK